MKIKVAAGFGAVGGPPLAADVAAALVPAADKPGTERWPVKTGQDPDRAKVGKNIINGQDLGAGIVQTTLETLFSLPRPPGLTVPTPLPPPFHASPPVSP